MEGRSKFNRFFAVCVALLVIAAMCVLLVACDPDGGNGDGTVDQGGGGNSDGTGGDGGNGDGGNVDGDGGNGDGDVDVNVGDKIFTADATLGEITEKLSAAKSFTFERQTIREGETEPYYVETYFASESAIGLLYKEFDSESGTWVQGEYYLVDMSGKTYEISIFADQMDIGENNTSCAEELSEFYTDITGRLTEENGVIIANENVLKNDAEYVEGSGTVVLSGTEIKICATYTNPSDGASFKKCSLLKGVNATKVEVSDDIMDAVREYIDGESGDAVFTENATLAEITAALEAAESITYVQSYSSKSEGGEEALQQFNFQFTRTAVGGVYSTTYAGAVISSGYNYMIAEGNVLYNISREDDELTASKDLLSNLAEDMLPPYFFNIYISQLLASLTEVDGRVCAVNPDFVLQMNGDSIIMTSESSEGGVVSKETHIYSLVNATEVTLTDEAASAMATADWSRQVNYNGVTYEYRKIGNSEFYCYYGTDIPDGAVPQSTINGFPVVSVDISPSETTNFHDGMTADEVRSVVNGAESMYVEFYSWSSGPGYDYNVTEQVYITSDFVNVEIYYLDTYNREQLRDSVWMFRYDGKLYYCQNLHQNGYWEPVRQITEKEMEDFVAGVLARAGLSALEVGENGLAINDDLFAEAVTNYQPTMGKTVQTGDNKYSVNYTLANSEGEFEYVTATINYVDELAWSVPDGILGNIVA